MGCCSSSSGSSQNHSGKPRPPDPRKSSEYSERLLFLRKVPLFKSLPEDCRYDLADACEPTSSEAGLVVVKQGDTGREFFVIWSGVATVHVNGKEVAKLNAGDYFGDVALLRDQPRNATVRAESKLVTLKITRDRFKQLDLNMKLQFANRKAVVAGEQMQVLTKASSPKTPEERGEMTEALRKCVNLVNTVSLDDSRIHQMIDVAWKEVVEEGVTLISEDDPQANYFYIVNSGSFKVFKNDHASKVVNADNLSRVKSKYQVNLGKGDCFGELALLEYAPRAATVIANAASAVWVIDRINFKNILMKESTKRTEEYMGYLANLEILAPLSEQERRALAEALIEMEFTKNENILTQDEPGSTFYILVEGEVAILQHDKEITTFSASRGKVESFGERALLRGERRRDATVTVRSETAKVLELHRDSCDAARGSLHDVIGRKTMKRKTHAMKRKTAAPSVGEMSSDIDRVIIHYNDVDRLGLLDCGRFGAVELCEHRATHAIYALKGLSKGYVAETGMQESVMNEKDVMLMTDSEFIIKLHETYNGHKTLYFLMEAALGGNLHTIYNRNGFYGSEEHALFYVAGVVYAFEHMHKKHIIYRDLKPENLLLTEKGHLKVTDMGNAKIVIGKTFTMCGTPDYIAPEVIEGSGHNEAVDWWTLGILTYELMVGSPPFASARSNMAKYELIKTCGISGVTFPDECKDTVVDLVKALVKKRSSSRLAMRPGGINNIQKHEWYTSASFDWNAMEELALRVPYKPVLKSSKDKSQFSPPADEDLPPKIEYKEDGSGWDRDFAT